MLALTFKAIGAAINLAGLVAPNTVASRVALLLLTPIPRLKPTEIDTFRELHHSAEETTFTIDGLTRTRTIRSWKIGDSDKRVLFCHGWGGNGTNGKRFFSSLLDEGYEIHTFDGPGHGLDKRRPTNLIEFRRVIDHLEKKWGPFDAAIGHSFGGASITYALTGSFSPKCVVLLAPMFDNGDATSYFLRLFGISQSLSANVTAYMTGFFADYLQDWDLSETVRTFDTPALMLHDPEDRRVPYSIAQRAADNWDGAKMEPIDDVGHISILFDPNVNHQVVKFITEAPAPARIDG